MTGNDNHFKSWLLRNCPIFIILFVFSALSLEVIDSWIIWDADDYCSSAYSTTGNVQGIMRQISEGSLKSIYDLYLCGHASLGWSLWLILFQLIKEGNAMVQIADITLALISIYAYYQILRKILGGGYASVLATLPYAFSPFVLGIVGDVNPDSAAMYYMVIFIACSLYKYEWLELIFAICFVFTKEPAIIYYTAYIAAKIVGEYLYNHSFRLMDFVKCAVCNIKNYIYALPIIGWLLL